MSGHMACIIGRNTDGEREQGRDPVMWRPGKRDDTQCVSVAVYGVVNLEIQGNPLGRIRKCSLDFLSPTAAPFLQA